VRSGTVRRSRQANVYRERQALTDVLPSSLEQVHRKLRGSDDGDRQMVAILTVRLAIRMSLRFLELPILRTS